MAAESETAFVHREIRGLIVLIVIAVAAFFVTRLFAQSNERRKAANAEIWFARGQAALAGHQPAEAAQMLRKAVALDRSATGYQLALAASLRSAGSLADARLVLLAARTSEPRNATVNLELGRLESSAGDLNTVVTYYHAALDEMWRPEDAARRHEVRTELARYLIAHGQGSRALSELLIISADMPDTAVAHGEVGALFLGAGESPRALSQIDRAIALNPADPSLHLAAGRAAFAAGDYGAAQRYLAGAAALPQARDLQVRIALVLSNDPLRPRLTSA